jgi:hypothetical protein
MTFFGCHKIIITQMYVQVIEIIISLNLICITQLKSYISKFKSYRILVRLKQITFIRNLNKSQEYKFRISPRLMCGI